MLSAWGKDLTTAFLAKNPIVLIFLKKIKKQLTCCLLMHNIRPAYQAQPRAPFYGTWQGYYESL